MKEPTVVSTFAGCGGSSLGYKMAGYKELLAIDFDKNACETFRLNFPDVPCWQRDIKEVTGEEILKEIKLKKGELDVLDGSPPCQGFSTSGNRKIDDPRNTLFAEYLHLARDLQPKVLVMENVSGLVKGHMKGVFRIILEEFKKIGYNPRVKLLNASNYEVPQNRQRLFFIAIRNDLDNQELRDIFPVHSQKKVTVGEALKNVKNKTYPPQLKGADEVLSQIPQGGCAIDYVDKITLSKYIPRMVKNTLFSFSGITQRLHFQRQSKTITATFISWSESPIHPTENRHLTIEECKRLCSFPDDFKLTGNFEAQWKLLGNAVMPLQMKAVAFAVKQNILDKLHKTVER